MSKKLEKQFRNEVSKRNRREEMKEPRAEDIFKIIFQVIETIKGVISIGFFAFLIWLVYFSPHSNQPLKDDPNKPKPVALPDSGTVKKYIPKSKESLGQIRLFLRAPLESEQSPIASSCSNTNNSSYLTQKYNYFVQFIDWSSNKIVSTAFIRDGDMVEVKLPLGSYKIRYAIGKEWYGEKNLFGSTEMYEMTDRYSSASAKLELTQTMLGTDLGFQCADGNLDQKVVPKESE
jgi:hypothetical protein